MWRLSLSGTLLVIFVAKRATSREIVLRSSVNSNGRKEGRGGRNGRIGRNSRKYPEPLFWPKNSQSRKRPMTANSEKTDLGVLALFILSKRIRKC